MENNLRSLENSAILNAIQCYTMLHKTLLGNNHVDVYLYGRSFIVNECSSIKNKIK